MSLQTTDDRPGTAEPGSDIALIGMAGHFPGARSVRMLWHNLRAGINSITYFTEEELRAEGVSEELLSDLSYVRAGSVLDGVDMFDAGFFGYSPREAQLLDPQQRLFLENAWHALEDAAIDPARFGGAIGVVAGSGLSTYLTHNLSVRPDLAETFGTVQVVLANDKDSLATRVAYTLDLTGPCYSVQSYCSTSLVAVSLACSTLISGEADVMLAGGVSVLVPHRVGYLCQDAGLFSPDGMCRAFDAAAQGTPLGSGVGVVVLRRLEDALAAGDRIYALIRGWAVNNDGANKVGFTAPGVRGQAGVIAEALASAGLSPADIDYVEAHGTGTRLGDAVEISAMQQVFGADGVTRCAIGSAKTNLGHLDRAAGVTGLIKTALSLHREEIPPTLNFEQPNPQMARPTGTLEVVTSLRPWPRGERIRRAGVSAFGMGGTNAHVVLEEVGLHDQAMPPDPRGHQLLVWSARTADTASSMAVRLKEMLSDLDEGCSREHEGTGLPDVAYTLQTGRAVFEHRRALVTHSTEDALRALGESSSARVLIRQDASRRRTVGFLLAGVGEHYQGMIGGLYESEPAFRSAVDECAEIFHERLGRNPMDSLLGKRDAGSATLAHLIGRTDQQDADPAETETIQPAIFAADYALGRLLMSWGIRPRVLLGYSVGEFAAACLSGSLTLSEAAGLVAFRAQLIARLPAGAMTAVPLSVAEVTGLVGPLTGTGVDVAAVNGPKLTVLSGPADAIREMSDRLVAADVPTRHLRAAHAFHSAMLRPAAPELTAWARTELRPCPPEIPYFSNVTGAIVTEQQIRDPGYWAEHMCRTVRFNDMLAHVLAGDQDVLLEIGPGQSLGAMARNHPDCPRDRWPLLLRTLPAQAEPAREEAVLTDALAQMWLAGVEIDWQAYHAHRNPRKVPVPDYPFQHERYWIDPPRTRESSPVASVPALPPADAGEGNAGEPAGADLLVPHWTVRPLPERASPAHADAPVWLLADDRGVADALAERLMANGHGYVLVRPGEPGVGGPDRRIRPAEQDDYRDLLTATATPRAVVHLWGLGPAKDSAAQSEPGRDLGFDSLRALTATLGDAGVENISLLVVTESARAVLVDDQPVAERATAFGPCLVAPQEYPSLEVRAVDVTLSAAADAPDSAAALAAALYDEIWGDGHAVALRAGRRLALEFVPAPEDGGAVPLLPRRGGVYLITGGLGPVGLALAEHLGLRYGATPVLASRRGLPPRAEWNRILAGGGDPSVRKRIAAVRRLAERGVAVETVTADVTDEARLREVIDDIAGRHGRLAGVFHLAAVTDPSTFRPLSSLGPGDRDAHFRAKIDGTLALERALADVPADFCLLFSSMSTVLGGIGFASYTAANSFLDNVVHRHRRDTTRWLTVNWDTWDTAAATIEAASFGASQAKHSLTRRQALDALDRILARPLPRTVVSAGALSDRIAQWVQRRAVIVMPGPGGERFPRPELAQQYVPPVGERQRKLAELWADLLGLDRVGARDNFADLGGTSLLALHMVKQIRKMFGIVVSAVSLFEAPSVHTMAQLLERLDAQPESAPALRHRQQTQPAAPCAVPEPASIRVGHIAIVGMAGRFPGAPDVSTFWHNLSNGIESVTRFSEEELLAGGVPIEEVRAPDYVPVRPVLDDIRSFDAQFFGYSPRDATVTDPQHRVFLECCWEVLEHGGYGAARGRGKVGVFAGTNLSSYLFRQVDRIIGASEADVYSSVIGNDKDSLSTGVSYKVGLTGPSLSVQTFCSSALVAVHLACQSLRAGECAMAIAGGVGIHVPDRVGHRYVPGGMESPDGRVRTFDASARGTLFGDGVGVVLLKRLDDAVADGDTVYAVIRGSAINNDGSLKAGYTAPSVVGQAAVVADAMAAAGVTAEDISYVEAHGTATELGDPIEVAALTRAFGETKRKQYCPIGSVKTNIGHLGAAAGASGLIKTALALRHRQIPPSLNFTEPNPEIDFPGGPFYVNTELSAWTIPAGRTRIAGINSLGMGGTNVHVVVEEAPEPSGREGRGPDRRYEILPVSARTELAADQAVFRLREHLWRTKDLELLDVAYTLQAGRETFEHRRVHVTGSLDDLRAVTESAGTSTHDLSDGFMRRADAMLGRPVDFLFAGVGEQYPGLVGELHRREPQFRSLVDECAAVLRETLGTDLGPLLTAPRDRPGGEGESLLARLGRGGPEPDGAAAELARTELAQPAVFVAEYALARLLMSWGIQPAVMLGYSIGEYVAACLAGVLPLPDALRLVAFRARLIARLPVGAMLAVPLSREQLASRFGSLAGQGIDIAAANGPELTVVGGEPDIISGFAARLAQVGLPGRRLATTHAFHTRLLEPARAELTAWAAANLRPQAPRLAYISNLTGDLATAELVADPGYWAEHMCSTVRFADGLARLLADADPVLLEIGPGQSLGAMARAHPSCVRDRWSLVVPTLPAVADPRPDDLVLAEGLARLWLAGVNLDWAAYQRARDPRRVPLPTYPFQRQEYWLESVPAVAAASPLPVIGEGQLIPLPKLAEKDWLHARVWRQTAPRGGRTPQGRWLIFTDTGPADEVCRHLVRRLADAGGSIVLARPATELMGLERTDGVYRFRPGDATQIRELVCALRDDGSLPDRVVHLWTLGGEPRNGRMPTSDDVETAMARGADTLIALATATGDIGAGQWSLNVVTSGIQSVTGAEHVKPELSTLTGPIRSIPLEYPAMECRLIDIDPVTPGNAGRQAHRIAEELGDGDHDPLVAVRNGRRWLPDYQRLPDCQPSPGAGPLRAGGVYLVTGGLGGIGLAMAERLASEYRAKLVLFGRTGLPPRNIWQAVLADPAVSEEVRRRLTGVLRLEELGSEVAIVVGDVSEPADARSAVRTAIDRFGALHGVLHAAGLPGIGLMQFKTKADLRKVMAPKIGGTIALEEALDGVPVDFLLLFSSITAATGGGPGQVAYGAANAFLDACAEAAACRGEARRTVSIGWGEWQWNAWEAGLAGYGTEVQDFFRANRRRFGIDFDAGWRALVRVLLQDQPHVVVSTQDFSGLVRLSRHLTVDAIGGSRGRGQEGARHPRPDLVTAFVAPAGEVECAVAEVWSDLLGLREIGADDSFFDLGGNSLIGMEVMARIRRRLSIDMLAPHVLYEAPTVASLARLLTVSDASCVPASNAKAGSQDRGEQRRRSLRRARIREAGEL